MRLFIALSLSEKQKNELHRLQQSINGYLEGVKWVSPEGMHLTLKFLGEVEPARIEAIVEAMAEAALTVEPFDFSFGGGGAFPSLQKARVIWAGLRGEVGKVAALASSLEAALVQKGFPAETRAFTPHLTLGRLRHPLPGEKINKFIAEAQTFSTELTRARAITLYQSRLSRQGATYSVLRQMKIGRFLEENAGNKQDDQE